MTFSPCFKKYSKEYGEYWITNWTQLYGDDFDWHEIVDFVCEGNIIGFGYVFSKGNNSRNVTSDRNRVVIWEYNEN